MTDLATNVLYYGDDLDILRRYLPDAAVDLVYLDPPFGRWWGGPSKEKE
jgi:16S rRNA G966 N2-methylase RsmD